MTDHRPRRGPYPSVGFTKHVQDVNLGPLYGGIQGAVTADSLGLPLAIARTSGRIREIQLSCVASGKDDTNALNFQADVKINGVTCLTTKPKIEHVSGEASQYKTTYSVEADTGITEAVINWAANEFSPGDIITWDFDITRTASPTTEISTPCIIVELEPAI